MVHPFISAPAPVSALRRMGGVSFSTVVHSVLIAGAVLATSPRTHDLLDTSGESAKPRIEEVQFVRTVPKEEERKDDKGATVEKEHSAKGADETVTPLIAVVEVTMAAAPDAATAIVTPAHDYDQETANWVALQFEKPATSIADQIRRLYAAAQNGAYDQDVVEKTVWPRPNNPKPNYPSSMLSAGIEAHVLMRFVVDSTGRVDAKSLVFPQGVHQLFTEAVKRALLRSRYFPAELAGRRVAQHVVQDFVFQIQR
jgi:TonB family protein